MKLQVTLHTDEQQVRKRIQEDKLKECYLQNYDNNMPSN